MLPNSRLCGVKMTTYPARKMSEFQVTFDIPWPQEARLKVSMGPDQNIYYNYDALDAIMPTMVAEVGVWGKDWMYGTSPDDPNYVRIGMNDPVLAVKIKLIFS
jgi:hypothetical protein